MKDICCIGHITVDKIITPSTNVIMPGGTSYYFSRGINCLPGKVSYELVTSVSNEQMDVVKGMRNLGVVLKKNIKKTDAQYNFIRRSQIKNIQKVLTIL